MTIEDGLRTDERDSARLRALYRSYGYHLYKVNRFEEYDLYMRNKNFLTDDRILTFTDTNGHLMALKPDITLSIVRNTRDEDIPIRVCYAESAYRVPRGESGFHEIMQTGLEYIGPLDAAITGEILTLAERSLSLLSDRYLLDVSSMGIVTGILHSAALSPEETRQALNMIRGKQRHSLMQLCRERELPEETVRLMDALVVLSGPLEETLMHLLSLPLPDGSRRDAQQLLEAARACGSVSAGHMNLDFSVLNDMGYYNGLTLSGFIDGIPAPVLSGGRYDPLLKRLGRNTEGAGFAVYLNGMDRLHGTHAEEETVLLYSPEEEGSVLEKAEALRRTGRAVVLKPKAAEEGNR